MRVASSNFKHKLVLNTAVDNLILCLTLFSFGLLVTGQGKINLNYLKIHPSLLQGDI